LISEDFDIFIPSSINCNVEQNPEFHPEYSGEFLKNREPSLGLTVSIDIKLPSTAGMKAKS